MPEVQESLLEHAAPTPRPCQNPQGLDRERTPVWLYAGTNLVNDYLKPEPPLLIDIENILAIINNRSFYSMPELRKMWGYYDRPNCGASSESATASSLESSSGIVVSSLSTAS